MGGTLKIELTSDKNVLEIYETEPGKLAFVMYPDDPKEDVWLDVTIETDEFVSLLKRLIDFTV